MKFEMSANEAGRHMSMTALTPQEDPESGVGFRQTCITTVIPIREEFRCRRAWFFYHDIRALVTSVSDCVQIFFNYRAHTDIHTVAIARHKINISCP